MDNKKQVASLQVGKEYIPILKQLAKADGRSMRKYIEVFIVRQAKASGLLTKSEE